MENELNKGKDMLRDLGESISELGQKIGKRFNNLVEELSTGAGEDSTFRPAADVYEMHGLWVVEMELPGVAKEGVKISVSDNVLTIKGTKSRAAGQASFELRERRLGNFIRMFELPEYVDGSGIKAKFSDGLLTVSFALPQPPEAETQTTTIDID